jgi:hypothetical protein
MLDAHGNEDSYAEQQDNWESRCGDYDFSHRSSNLRYRESIGRQSSMIAGCVKLAQSLQHGLKVSATLEGLRTFVKQRHPEAALKL